MRTSAAGTDEVLLNISLSELFDLFDNLFDNLGLHQF